MSENIPPIPSELCGIRSCVFLPHPSEAPHSWVSGVGSLVNDTRSRLDAIRNGPRIYTSDAHGGDFRREPDTAVRETLEAAGRKVFTTKGDAG